MINLSRFKFLSSHLNIKIKTNHNHNILPKKILFPSIPHKNFGITDFMFNPKIKNKLKEKFDNYDKGIRPPTENLSSKFANVQFDNIENENLRDLLKRYADHVSAREKRRLNFNRKDRWKQRELDDIMKNFDVKQAKFRDYAKLSREANIVNIKQFHSIDEIYFYLDELLSEGFLEKHISMALDIFIKDIKFFDDTDNPKFKRFVSELSRNAISLSDDVVIYKAVKFLDWYNISDQNCWYNIERVIVNNKNTFNRSLLLKILDHFAHQNEGSIEFYDLYQYLFWSGDFSTNKITNSDFISLGYNMYLTKQGYSQFFYDYYKQLLPRITQNDATFDLLKVIQTFSEISEYYFDIYKKIEDIILSRYEQLELNDATVIACGYSVSGAGSNLLFDYMEKLITSKFTQLDKNGFRETVRAFIISQSGTPQFFMMMMYNIKDHLELFNLQEKVLIVKCYSDKKYGNEEFYSIMEKAISKDMGDVNELLLDEICMVAASICENQVYSREFQKLFEHVVAQRINDITANKKVSKFLYNLFFKSGMCSVGLMNMFHKSFSEANSKSSVL